MLSDDVRQLEQEHTKILSTIEKAMNIAMRAMGDDANNPEITPLFRALADIHSELEPLVLDIPAPGEK